ncbi:MAG: outer membrane beta-barrel protein [Verrucomicrobia bacterium]|nr:outer membrane beta-barrel protein [Verrucomicrobiota bacterium]
MKKIIASAGLVAFGAAGLQAAYAPGLSTQETSKPWSISATLRGFYDDNYNTAPAGTNKLDSFGFEVMPKLGLNLPLDQTYIGLRYIYDLKYYIDREKNKYDQTHQFDAILSHTFTERYSLDLTDSFALAQEPELLEPSGGTLVRTEGNNIRNRAAVNFNAQLTTLLGLALGYSNTFVDYDQTDDDKNVIPPSRSYLLDRMEHLANIDLRWQMLRQTVGVLGYQFGIVDFMSNETIASPIPPPATVPADSRNNRSHYVYIGADQTFRPDLTGSVRVGGQYVDYFNDSTRGNIISPYANASLTYNYTTGSSVQLGVRHGRNATDIAVLDQESTGVYLQLNHRITPNLTGNLMGQFQHSVANGSRLNDGTATGGIPADGEVDNFYLVGLNLAYRFNQYLSAEVGYNYDRLISDLSGRSFSRNRAYVGVTASY